MKALSFANRANADLIDENYKIWQERPEALDSEWRAFFEGFELAQPLGFPAGKADGGSASNIPDMIRAYRTLGHTQAAINPLSKPTKNPALALESLGINPEDLNKTHSIKDYLGGKSFSGKEIVQHLQKTYCGSVGCEYMHIQDAAKRRFLESHMEPNGNEPSFSKDQCIHILTIINAAETFESFLHTRYVGQKRFSLEGGEALIAALNGLIEKCPQSGVKEVVIGMAHRGRLNVLANIMGKSYNFIFKEFSENYIPESIYGDGDVKYHLGYKNTHVTKSGEQVALALAANPSHLEAVDAVVEGQARARQRMYSMDRKRVLPVLIHGDAAVAGQGVVTEVLNLSKLEGYKTGGTIHFVVNNQIGFTTSPQEGRSSTYCTDIAKMLEAPIFHVNGDDPLAVVMIAELALKYRQEFQEDVFIDMYCYRKHGHNESDEPMFTQPTLYKQIKAHKPTSFYLHQQLVEKGLVEEPLIEEIEKSFEAKLQAIFTKTKEEREKAIKFGKQSNQPMLAAQPSYHFGPIKTAVAKNVLEKVTKALTHIPEGFTPNPKVERQLKSKTEAFEARDGIDWGFAEGLAFGTLLIEGIPIRLSGQDSERGTFSHRHAVLYDLETQQQYTPLKSIDPNQALFCVHNSSLSEAAVLGFDFGYSLDYPQMLCLWEAQFGDFANSAQVIIDQFITSCESKWQLLSSLTLLLPHGYEGQGPEHSSARLERFLQSCAEDNIQVCNVTTPAQIFHLLRKQKKQPYLKPLVIMSPKSLLRHKRCVSTVKELTEGHFNYILDDPARPKKAKRLILCSGKVYYDLLDYKEVNQEKDVAIVRIEQLYPLDKAHLQKIFEAYSSAKYVVWCQEEPKNMGAWHYMLPELHGKVSSKQKLLYAGRRAASSPATGALAVHKVEQEALVEEAFRVE